MNFSLLFLDSIKDTIIYLTLFTVLFIIAKFMKDIFTHLDIDEELTEHDNAAVSLTLCGYYFATAIIFIGAVYGPSLSLRQDIASVSAYTLLGLLLLNISRYINDHVIFGRAFSVVKMCRDHNTAVGVAQCGTYIATGFIAAASVSGRGGGVATSVVFFILGQITLFIFNRFYDLITPFKVRQELREHNLACGVALSGTLIALGILIANGIRGDFISWQVDLTSYGVAVLIACLFLPIVRIFMNRLIIPRTCLSHEIAHDKNVGAGLLEACIAISFSLVLTQIV